MNQLTLGESLRDSGIKRVSDNNREWLEEMRTEARWQCALYGHVTIDELREHAHRLGWAPEHPNAWGAVFKQKCWECIGCKKSRIASNHAREVRVWRLKEDNK